MARFRYALFSAILFTSLFSFFVTASSSPGSVSHILDEEGRTRYYVHSSSASLRAQFGVNNEFPNGFTVDVDALQADALLTTARAQGVLVDALTLYHLIGTPKKITVAKPATTAKKTPSKTAVKPATVLVSDSSRACKPSTPKPYGIVKVNGGSGGKGVIVAVLDSGVDVNHPDLHVSLCKDATKKSVKDGCADGNGHGTHVMGTIGANGGSDGKGILGVAPQATLWSIKVCNSAGSCWSDAIARALRYAADNGANVISMSLGSSQESPLISDAINYAVGKGVLIVAAAGNEGPAPDSIGYPGANPIVVSVAAVDSAENVPAWSSRGVNDGDYKREAREVELAAPGVNVESTWPGGCYNTISGTSMATPHVSGLAAKLWKGSAPATRRYLDSLAKKHDIAPAGDDPYSGFGMPVAP